MKSARRIKAVGIADTLPLFSVTYLSERNAKPSRPLIGLEGETVVVEEPASHSCRVELRGCQVRIFPAPSGLGVHPREEIFYPGGRGTGRFERPAAQTGAITCDKRLTDRRVKIDILEERFLRGACWAAEYSGRSYGGEEDAVIGAITLGKRPVHSVGGRQCSDCHDLNLGSYRTAFHRKLDTEFSVTGIAV